MLETRPRDRTGSYMLNRIFMVVIVVPAAVILITLAVANRELVQFTVDPFNPGNPSLSIQMPFFIYLFLALALGVLIGSFATWLNQAQYRKLARRRGQEVDAMKLMAARQAPIVHPSQLGHPGHSSSSNAIVPGSS